jgi:hypothetical protein
MVNLLRNGDFMAGLEPAQLPNGSKPRHRTVVYKTEATPGPVVEVFEREAAETLNPLHWRAWHMWQANDDTPVGWDPHNLIGWATPETRLTDTVHNRHLVGHTALQIFTWSRIHQAGVYQQLTGAFEAGQRLRLSAQAHAWVDRDGNPPSCSLAGCGPLVWPGWIDDLSDDQRALDFRIGLDPTGGADPTAATVRWSEGWYIYNAYHHIALEVELEADAQQMTVFLRSSALWPVPHNDAYWDDVRLEIVGAEPPEPPVGGGPYIARGTKLGYHCIAPRQVPGHIAQLAQQGAPVPLVKFVDDWAALKTVKEASPQTLTLARKTFPLHLEHATGLGDMTDEQIVVFAGELMDLLRAKCLEEAQYDNGQRLEYIDYLETVVNEADIKVDDGSWYARLAKLMIAMLDIAEAWDLPCKRLALFSLNCGTPEWVDYVAMVNTGVFERMQAGGHVLSLHEGTLAVGGYTWEEAPIDLWWGPEHTLPGAPEIPGTGSLCFRYRYLLHLLRERGLYVPIVISEFYAGGGYTGADPDDILERMRWYDELAAEDPELLAFTPFTFGGAGVGWDEQDYDFILDAAAAYTLEAKERVNASPEAQPLPPERDYDVIVELAPQKATLAQLHAIRAAVFEQRRTVAQSAQDAVRLADQARDLIRLWHIAPEGRDIWRAWIEARTPARYEFVELAVPLQVVPWSQNHPLWRNLLYAGTGCTLTFGRAGCLVVSITMIASLAYAEDLDPPTVAAMLRNVDAFSGCYLQRPERIPQALNRLEWAGFVHWREQSRLADLDVIQAELDTYGATICEVRWTPGKPPVPNNQHFVVVERLEGNDALIVDPWSGERKWLTTTRYCGPGEGAREALTGLRRVRPVTSSAPPPSPPAPPVLPEYSGAKFGFHASPNESVPGDARLVVIYASERPGGIQLHDDGRDTYISLRHSWSVDRGGAGTMPAPGPELDEYLRRCALIVNQNPHARIAFCNEINNPREHPRGHVLTPPEWLGAFLRLRALCPNALLSLGALDPYNAETGDPRAWIAESWGQLPAGACQWVETHAYVFGPHPDLVGSDARFDDEPLTWMRFNFPGPALDIHAQLPLWAQRLPLAVTEFNHIYRSEWGDWGWVDDDRAVQLIRRTKEAAQEARISAVFAYRWSGDEWRLHTKSALIAALTG